MTINEAIEIIDQLKPNTYTTDEKLRWLSNLDGKIKEEIIDTHEGGEDVVFEGYTGTVNMDAELLVKAPHDDIYIKWLEAQMDYANGEMRKYNNSITAFNDEYTAFRNSYNRRHMPKGRNFSHF